MLLRIVLTVSKKKPSMLLAFYRNLELNWVSLLFCFFKVFTCFSSLDISWLAGMKTSSDFWFSDWIIRLWSSVGILVAFSFVFEGMISVANSGVSCWCDTDSFPLAALYLKYSLTLSSSLLISFWWIESDICRSLMIRSLLAILA